jgi:hypothetical protein
LKRELGGSATFDASSFKGSDGCHLPILAVLSIFSSVSFGSRLPIRAEASRVKMNFSQEFVGSEPGHLGINEINESSL